jgi:hypothetical protein
VKPTNRPGSRYRLRPLRLALALLSLAVVASVFFAAPRRLSLALSMPAPSALTVRGAAAYQHTAQVAYSGRCLALMVRDDGSVLAVITSLGQAVLLSLAADGSSSEVELRLPGEALQAIFFGGRSLAMWSSEADQSTGTWSGFGRLPDPMSWRSFLQPSWTHPLELALVRFQPAGQAVMLIGAGSDAVPRTSMVLDAQGRTIHTETLSDGVFTAWSSAALTGGFALAGATYTDAGMIPFYREYGPDGSLVTEGSPLDGPPLLLALSPTGKFLFAVTPKAANLWQSDGKEVWSHRFPGSRAVKLRAFADGRTLLSSADTTLAIDLRGRVYQRWRAPALGPVAPGGPPDLAVMSLPGGCAVLDAAGVGHGLATWEGSSELVAVDSAAHWLVRAGAGQLQLLRLSGNPAP